LRENSRELLHELFEGELTLSHSAQDVYQALQANGASFFADIQQASGRLASEVEEALWELASAGLVSADGFDNLRALIDPRRRSGQASRRKARPRHAAGRWAPLRRDAGEVNVESAARRLLKRWGVVFRDLMRRESNAPPWRNLLQEFRRMEARGEVRGGRFVAAYVGEQFALPEAVDLLRSVRRSAPDGETLTIAASDPLNLVGIVLPGDRISVLSASRVVFQDGHAKLDDETASHAPGRAGESIAHD
jgi:ATP-dependent Lhr-like helicase